MLRFYIKICHKRHINQLKSLKSWKTRYQMWKLNSWYASEILLDRNHVRFFPIDIDYLLKVQTDNLLWQFFENVIKQIRMMFNFGFFFIFCRVFRYYFGNFWKRFIFNQRGRSRKSLLDSCYSVFSQLDCTTSYTLQDSLDKIFWLPLKKV